MQRKSARWHCAARREITERSEEAPAANAAQPSPGNGIRKAQGGDPGGVQRGPRRGAAPNRPPLPPAAQAAQMRAIKANEQLKRLLSRGKLIVRVKQAACKSTPDGCCFVRNPITFHVKRPRCVAGPFYIIPSGYTNSQPLALRLAISFSSSPACLDRSAMAVVHCAMP